MNTIVEYVNKKHGNGVKVTHFESRPMMVSLLVKGQGTKWMNLNDYRCSNIKFTTPRRDFRKMVHIFENNPELKIGNYAKP